MAQAIPLITTVTVAAVGSDQQISRAVVLTCFDPERASSPCHHLAHGRPARASDRTNHHGLAVAVGYLKIILYYVPWGSIYHTIP